MSLSRKTTAAGMLSFAAAATITMAGPAHAQNVYGSIMKEPIGDGNAAANFYASWSANSQQEADDMAAQQCGSKPGGGPDCYQFFQWANGCASIASGGSGYQVAYGATRGEAEARALGAAAGPASTGSMISLPPAPVATYCLPPS